MIIKVVNNEAEMNITVEQLISRLGSPDWDSCKLLVFEDYANGKCQLKYEITLADYGTEKQSLLTSEPFSPKGITHMRQVSPDDLKRFISALLKDFRLELVDAKDYIRLLTEELENQKTRFLPQ